MVAAVGMTVATELYLLGVITTLLTTGVLAALAPLSVWLSARAEQRDKKKEQSPTASE
jgi:uncharacterized membrane protein YhiD involved in acid resistance